MLFYLIFGFLSGALVPFLAGRFGKIIPADPGLLILRLFHFPHFPKPDDPMRIYILSQKWKKLWIFSFIWGIVLSALFLMCFYFLPSSYVVWGCVFCWILIVSMVIDAQYWLLPDFFTIPLLLLGFVFAYYHPEFGTQNALIGSISGYLISVFSVLFLSIFSSKNQFGGGDLKMITAVGAWLGILGLNYTLILSFLLFIILNILPFQKKGAYGPALGIASIICFFIMYIK